MRRAPPLQVGRLRRARPAVLLALLTLYPGPLWADDRASGLAPPRGDRADRDARESHGASASDDFAFDLLVATVLPLTIGVTLLLEMPAGIQVRVSGGVVPPVYADAINDVGQAWSIWGDGTASALSEVLRDSIVLEAALGIRPGSGPLEVAVGYVLFWSEGPAPVLASAAAASLSVSAYAIHAELGVRAPIGDALVFRVAIGWLHTLAHDVSLRPPESGASTELGPAESMIGDWIGRYGLGPTLSASFGAHFD